MSDAARAAELAEQIVEEVASIEQSWPTIAALARALTTLAEAAADEPPD